jgi:hypothetical protein
VLAADGQLFSEVSRVQYLPAGAGGVLDAGGISVARRHAPAGPYFWYSLFQPQASACTVVPTTRCLSPGQLRRQRVLPGARRRRAARAAAGDPRRSLRARGRRAAVGRHGQVVAVGRARQRHAPFCDCRGRRPGATIGHAPRHLERRDQLRAGARAGRPLSRLEESGIDFDWLDKRPRPGRLQAINKRTGKEMKSEDIVKGIKQDNGEYVILSEDEIKEAYPKSTQTIAIETFVKADEISFTLLEKPYYTAPVAKGEKVYALLREAMKEAGVIGIARVVMHTKERLAALIPTARR